MLALVRCRVVLDRGLLLFVGAVVPSIVRLLVRHHHDNTLAKRLEGLGGHRNTGDLDSAVVGTIERGPLEELEQGSGNLGSVDEEFRDGILGESGWVFAEHDGGLPGVSSRAQTGRG